MIYHKSDLRKRSQELRRNTAMTDEEKKLWYNFLKYYSPGFHRQYVLQHYILDFYCPTAKLAIELDGSQHYTEEGLAYDARRTEFIEKFGIKVIRFTNTDINRNLDGVCEEIDKVVKERNAV